MPCYKPLDGYRSKTVNESGKRSIVFNEEAGFKDRPVKVPCGQCIGCRLERSRQWAMRIMHEASCYQDNAFITLTYDDDHVPTDNSLVKHHYQDFMKRLRATRPGQKIRYYHCGEYGETTYRPHYHACLFNIDFSDKKLLTANNGNNLYTSEELEKIWGKGLCSVGDLTFESAAYVARYVVKKQTGEAAERHYWAMDPRTGLLHQIEPEYATMSLKPGIGEIWYNTFREDTYKDDTVIMNGYEMAPPKYYDSKLEKEDPTEYLRVKRARLVAASKHKHNNTRERLDIREKVKTAAQNLYSRKL